MKTVVRTVVSVLLFGYVVSDGTTPDQVHISFTNVRSEMAVVWNTYISADQNVVYNKKGSTSFMTATGTDEKWVYNDVVRYTHKAVIKGLEFEAEYEYTIADRSFSFKTLPEDPKSYKVCVFGDLGYWHGNSTESIIRHGLAGDFHFIVHVGDIAYDLHSNNGKVGDDYLNQFEPLISKVPYMVIAGNHEDDYANFTNYQKRFMMPNNGFSDNQFYSFDLGPVHWVGVSTENYGYYYTYGIDPVYTQYNWLKKDLASANANRDVTPWIMTFQHRPFYCSNTNSAECQSFENRLVRVGWLDMPGLEPLFLQNSVDLGFWGHEHSYERFYPVADRTYWSDTSAYTNPKAPIYLITGSAGCHSPDAEFTKNPWPWSAVRNNDYGWSVVTVANATHIRIEQISLDKDENTVDDFWIVKDIGHLHSHQLRSENLGTKFPQQKCHVKDVACMRSLQETNEEL